MNEIEEGTRTLNALYDTLISGNHLPNSETSFSILDTTILTELQNCANKYHFFPYGFVKFNLVPFSPKPHLVQR